MKGLKRRDGKKRERKKIERQERKNVRREAKKGNINLSENDRKERGRMELSGFILE